MVTAAGEAWLLMHHLTVAHRQQFAAIAAEFGLSPALAIALQQLDPDEPLAMGSLARALCCDNSNVTGMVGRLEEQGLVERRTAVDDRRVKQVGLTRHGRDVRRRLHTRMCQPPAALAGLSDKDQRALRDVLRRAVED